MERFVIIVNDWKPLTIITKHSILDVAAALDLPLILSKQIAIMTQCVKHYTKNEVFHQEVIQQM